LLDSRLTQRKDGYDAEIGYCYSMVGKGPRSKEELLVRYGHSLGVRLDRRALARLLSEDVPGALDGSRAMVLLADGHELAATDGSDLRLPMRHAAVRWVDSGGEAMRVKSRLRDQLAQDSDDLDATAVWVPLMRSADLHGIWLLGERRDYRAYAPQDLRWLTEAPGPV
jgi:hypothetical protein